MKAGTGTRLITAERADANELWRLFRARAQLLLPPGSHGKLSIDPVGTTRHWVAMSFRSLFVPVLLRHPRTALAALFWRMTGRRVRARNYLLEAAAGSSFAYAAWIGHVERQPHCVAEAGSVIASWSRAPRFTIILCDGPEIPIGARDRSIASVLGQCYPYWDLVVAPYGEGDDRPIAANPQVRRAVRRADGATALTHAVRDADGDWIIPMPPGTRLPPTALFHHAEAIMRSPHAVVTYGDQDRMDARGQRSEPWFKPRWDGEMILAQDYASDSCAIRFEQAQAALAHGTDPGTADAYAILLAVTRAAGDDVVHVPHVVAHLDRAQWREPSAARLNAVRRHVAVEDGHATSGPFGSVHVSWPLPAEPPRVSILVPTRDKADLVRACVDSVVRLTDYPAYEIIVIDNGSVEPETFALFAELAQAPYIRILPYPHAYNYAAINNFAAAEAAGEYLCLLNNDTEVLTADWLTEMMRQAVRPGTGAVGAKLLYPDRSIQHAGVVIGMGNAAGHAHRHLPPDEPGYFAQAHIARHATAVTAACLVVAKEKYEAVGGLDETAFRIAYNDVDLCLKLEQAGWRNLYVPRAELIHHESKSRGQDLSPAHIERYRTELAALQRRWATDTVIDPTHHPRLDRTQESYVVRL